ncbi:MAG: hypothetical protein Salg2KO_02350 [Salibacteraceae bacterium]
MNRALIILLIVLSAVGQSCKSSRDAAAMSRDHLPNRTAAEISDSLALHDLQCDWLSIKYEVEIKTSKIDDSFKLYARIRRDSAIWISATYYAVEIGRFLFTPDTVMYMDRKNNQFYVGNYDYITNRFQIESDFKTLQALILGNGKPFLDQPNDKLHVSKGNDGYKLSYLKDGQIKRALRKEESKNPIDLNVSLIVDPESFRVQTTSILDIEDDRSLTAIYSNQTDQCNSNYPETIVFQALSANEQATVKTSVIKITTGKPVSLSFTIPEKYEPLAP